MTRLQESTTNRVIVMASQRLTIAKIAGIAAEVTLRRFRAWRNARLVNNPNEWAPEQWPDEIRRRADDWADSLRAHAHQLPVVFFAEYIDLWSFGPRYSLAEYGLINVMADRHELFCMGLPFSKALTQHLTQIQSDRDSSEEERFFALVTLEAASAWDRIIGTSVLVFLRHVIGGSITDEEVFDSLQTTPEWMVVEPQEHV